MIDLTDFQEVVGLMLNISNKKAAKVQRSWPNSYLELRKALISWKDLTKSTISGTDLLRFCKVVWEERPDDLALAEGRTILYHPFDGTPIAENSPFDGISAETLAFLRWSITEGHLNWTDEVVISREVKSAKGVIFDLPPDRFYGMHLLPMTNASQVDWGNVELAEAKLFIETGKIRAHAKKKSDPLYFSDDTLEGVLSLMPALRDEWTRNRLLNGLPTGACGAIPRNSAYGIDIANIVTAVEGFGRLSSGQPAINVLIDNAIKLVFGTKKAAELASFKVD